MRYLALDLEVGKRNERIHALAAVDADGVGTLDEAKERLAKIEKRHRGPLVRIVERLINAPIDEGVSTDELMALSALSRDGVRNALHDLEQLGIANNDTTLATYIHEGCRTLVGATLFSCRPGTT